MAKKAQTTLPAETLEPKIYEIGFLLSPAVREEDLAARIDELKASITKFGADIFAEGTAEFIDLAYEMSKVIDNKRIRFNQAYFGWLKFELDPSKMNELKEVLDKNTTIVRYLLTMAVRENTIIGKKPLGKILKAGKREAITETDIPEQALDQAIDQVSDQENINILSSDSQEPLAESETVV